MCVRLLFRDDGWWDLRDEGECGVGILRVEGERDGIRYCLFYSG